MKRNYFLIASIVIILLIVPITIIAFLIQSYNNKISTCPYINTNIFGRDISFEDCFGIISIDRRTLGEVFYMIKDDKHSYSIEIVKTTRQYKLSNGYLYIYRMPDSNFQTTLGNDKIYYEKLFMNGEIKTIEYDSFDKIPRYIKVDTNTGEVVLFNATGEMSEVDKKIFEELERIQ